MQQYYDLVNLIRETGDQLENRTGIDAITIPGAAMYFRMKDGFPMLGGRFTPFKSMIGELVAFYNGCTNAAQFRALGSKVWDKNANDPGMDNSNAWLRNAFRRGEDHLGPIYGDQWRAYPGCKFFEKHPSEAVISQIEKDGWEFAGSVKALNTIEGEPDGWLWVKKIDQLGDAIRTVIKNPNSRRILWHAWNPAVLDEISLPACHLLYQLLPNPKTKVLNICVYLRSNDVGLGAPYNISQAAAQLHFISRLTGYTPGTISYFTGDAHVYVNQLEWLDEQLELWNSGQRFDLPRIEISERVPDCSHDPEEAVAWLTRVVPEDFILHDYKYHTLKTPTPPMAV